jgi:hypothetical protein
MILCAVFVLQDFEVPKGDGIRTVSALATEVRQSLI